MVIEVVAQNFKMSENLRTKIVAKFSRAIGKYLNSLDEDLKIATIAIQKNPRFGYSLKFDMQLPWTHAYAQQSSPLLFVGVVGLCGRASRQIRKETEKMKEKHK